MGVLVLLAWTLAAVAPAAAQVSSQDQRCITTFNKSVRSVAKAHRRTVDLCLRDFARGILSPASPEACLRSDPEGKLERATGKALGRIARACAGGIPGFGVGDEEVVLVQAAKSLLDVAHGAIGEDLDTDLIDNGVDASCQWRVASTLLACHDTRLNEFLRCQKAGLRSGQVTNAASLAATCLGTGSLLQPDPSGRIARDCDGKLASTIARSCPATALAEAFSPCGASGAAAAAECLATEPACQVCRLLAEADGLSRDCDEFDDGDGGNGSCGIECADGVLQAGEACDDGGTSGGDGCSATCQVEIGWKCTGSPSVCGPSCGDGDVDAGEGCDDGDTSGGDGCSATCQVEPTYTCTGAPSACTSRCGNGVVQPPFGEVCDDGDGTGGDGCSAACQVEPGYLCSGQPSTCTFVCGNGTFQPGESCDDLDAQGGDGCSAACQIETGWLCSGQPSHCVPRCGDGLLRGGETCDDGDATSGDGCSFACQAEAGYSCASAPSNCVPVCGDGFQRGFETCDDGNLLEGDGCSATLCRREVGWSCFGQPSVCTLDCGDGNLDGEEECDDGDAANGDGCDASCRGEPGYACGGQPSVCALTCGNAVLEGAESCDDGNASAGDGCSASCRNEPGSFCGAPGSPCQPFEVFIDAPVHGTFSTAATTTVTGHYTALPPGVAAITVNGVAPTTFDPSSRTFSLTLALSGGAIANPIRVNLINTATGDLVTDRVVVIAGESVADGDFSPESVALRMNDTGIDAIEPLISDLARGQFDLAELVPTGTVLLPWQCYVQILWCWAGAEARIGSPAPSFGDVHFNADAKAGEVGASISLDNLRIDIDIDGTGLAPDCGLRLTADRLNLTGDYTLGPDPINPSQVDVNLAELTGVTFDGFERQFVSGNCGPVEGQLGDVEQLAQDAITGFIDDPDGPGPLDSPLADAVEEGLSGVSIAGGIGSGLGMRLDAPLFDVIEDPAGLTFGADARFLVDVGGGPGQCLPPPGAPDLDASYAPPEVFPTFGALTTGGVPYGAGVAISTAGFNQLLRGQTECGLLRTTLDTIDLDGAGGSAPVPLTAGLLSLLAPEFSQLPPATPLKIEVTPTLAPFVTGNAGPAGQLTELLVAQVKVDIVEAGPEIVWLAGVFDARLGMDAALSSAGLGVVLHEPAAADTTMVILGNPLGANATQLETVLPALIRPMIPSLAGAFAGFPLPEFLGLQLQGFEVARSGQFITLFANLTTP